MVEVNNQQTDFKQMQDKAAKIVNKESDSWFYSNWRPAIGWSYILICLFDFFIAPIVFPILSYYLGIETIIWKPLTLEGGGLYHVAIGAIVGVTAWGRNNLNMFLAQVASKKQPEEEMSDDDLSPPKKKKKEPTQ